MAFWIWCLSIKMYDSWPLKSRKFQFNFIQGHLYFKTLGLNSEKWNASYFVMENFEWSFPLFSLFIILYINVKKYSRNYNGRSKTPSTWRRNFQSKSGRIDLYNSLRVRRTSHHRFRGWKLCFCFWGSSSQGSYGCDHQYFWWGRLCPAAATAASIFQL